MNLKFMILANCETGAQNRLFNNAKLNTAILATKTKKDVFHLLPTLCSLNLTISLLHLKSDFLNVIIK
jgi:hypothetical protein